MCVPLLIKRSREHLSVATVLLRVSRAESCFRASDTEHKHTQIYAAQMHNNVNIYYSYYSWVFAQVGAICSAVCITPEPSWSLLFSTANLWRWSSLAASGTEEQEIQKRNTEPFLLITPRGVPPPLTEGTDRCVTCGELLCGAQWFGQVGHTVLHGPQTVRHICVCTHTHTHTHTHVNM